MIPLDKSAPELHIVPMIVLLIFGSGRVEKVSREPGADIRQFKQGKEHQRAHA